ncbi:low molecular weight phosphatase family protein [Phenylobacterium sp.]|jgi:protein-tyrosine-phosphatase|uniref:arsenate-mycothiol transferase ArsC n=1 Tax=Phenylobacterium sp. TaxID=1871053 RepID=UPI002F41FF72
MASDAAYSRPGAVLFACNFNRVRSPMAEALLRRAAHDRIYVDSCGLHLDPRAAEGVDPFVEAVMAELACDLAGHAPKTFDDLQDGSFDLVVSFTPEAQHRAVEMARGRSVEIEYWPIIDPTQAEGSREARLAAYRDVRDHLAARIARRFAVRPQAG